MRFWVGILDKLLTKGYTHLQPLFCHSSCLDAIARDKVTILKSQCI
jgi:hypothetical protein